MKILRAIGAFFARIGRWIKETAWIQPLLIVGAIFAVIFAIPHIIDGVKGWFDESDAANKYFTRYQLSLEKADVIPEGQYIGTSEVDVLFTNIKDRKEDEIKSKYGDRFFVAFVTEDNSTCKYLQGICYKHRTRQERNYHRCSNRRHKALSVCLLLQEVNR